VKSLVTPAIGIITRVQVCLLGVLLGAQPIGGETWAHQVI
jgi:hypothetical protein